MRQAGHKPSEIDRGEGANKMEYGKDDFMEMIKDWQTDNSPEYDDLKIEEAEINENGKWESIAEDEKCTYSLTDDGTGNIVINYLDTK
jgi:hypothetical protein